MTGSDWHSGDEDNVGQKGGDEAKCNLNFCFTFIFRLSFVASRVSYSLCCKLSSVSHLSDFTEHTGRRCAFAQSRSGTGIPLK